MIDIVQGAGAVVPFWLPDSGSPATGLPSQTFSGAEIQVAKPGLGWVNFAGSVLEAGGAGNGLGLYWLTITAGESGLSLTGSSLGKLAVKINKVGAVPNRIVEYTVGVYGPGAVGTTSIDAIRDALLNFAHNGTHTVRGTLRRLEALLTGKRAGMRGTGTAIVYAPDNSTPAFSSPINETAGTADSATIPGGTA